MSLSNTTENATLKMGSPDFLVEVCMLIYSQRTD